MDYNKQTVEEYELYASFNKCIICYSRPNNCLYLDCRHNVTCLTCGKLLEQCPICRKEITDYVRLYTWFLLLNLIYINILISILISHIAEKYKTKHKGLLDIIICFKLYIFIFHFWLLFKIKSLSFPKIFKK